MYHSILISDRNTYTEWGLIPTERPVVSPAPVKSGFIDLPNSNESIDYTEFLTGQPHYGQRTGSWTFYFDPEWTPPPEGIIGVARSANWILNNRDKYMTGKMWATIYSSLLNYVHGKVHRIRLEDAPDTIYEGRLTVDSWRSSMPYSQITISYNLNPGFGIMVENPDF